MAGKARKLDPSRLPGDHRKRVFVGGSYSGLARDLLDDLGKAVKGLGFFPVIADEYHLPVPDRDIHDVALFLLHSCRLAVFEASQLSGALMEIERTADYGTQCLILYADRSGSGYLPSRMLDSFVRERSDRLTLKGYVRSATAVVETKRWLTAMRRSIHA